MMLNSLHTLQLLERVTYIPGVWYDISLPFIYATPDGCQEMTLPCPIWMRRAILLNTDALMGRLRYRGSKWRNTAIGVD